MAIQVAIKKSEAKLRIVYSEVYAPLVPDSDGEFMTAEEIRKMAHGFLRHKRVDKIDHGHTNELVPGASVVESFVARPGDPDFIEGAWVIGVHVPRDEDWDRIEKQEWNSFSIEAIVTKTKRQVEVEIPPVISGLTLKGDDGHTHTFFVTYGSEGQFLGGRTDVQDGHHHIIKRGTITEEAEGHTHRFSHVENLSITG